MEIRYQPDQPILLTVLGGAAPRQMPARMVQMSGRRAQLCMSEAIACGTPLKIQTDDSMLLGEVSACGADMGSFFALVEIQDAIPSMSALAKLVAAVMNEGRGQAREPINSKVGVAL